MILVIDNYDSFAYNLVQYVGEFADEIVVRRNDDIDVKGIGDLDPDGIVVSPGPGTPEDAGVSIDAFAETEYPALGVCLGHQALCAAEGVAVGHAPEVVHGKPSKIRHDGKGLFADLPPEIEVGRYHSLAADEDLPPTLVETAWTSDDRDNDRDDNDREILMGVRHVEKPHFGVQFHPESILTPAGKRLVERFCEDIAGEK